MTNKQIEEKVKELILDKFGWVFKDELSSDNASLGDMGFDSLDVIELQLQIENAFKFSCFGDYLTTSSTLKDVVNFVYKFKKE